MFLRTRICAARIRLAGKTRAHRDDFRHRPEPSAVRRVQKIISTINASKIPVLAIDVPSGLNATRRNFGACVEAAVTLTIGARNGFARACRVAFVGKLNWRKMSASSLPARVDLNWTQPEDFQNFRRRGKRPEIKAISAMSRLSRQLGYHGAAVLAVRGAQRAQPDWRRCSHRRDLSSGRRTVAVRDGAALEAELKLSDTATARSSGGLATPAVRAR